MKSLEIFLQFFLVEVAGSLKIVLRVREAFVAFWGLFVV
jgi:hypothetical protein